MRLDGVVHKLEPVIQSHRPTCEEVLLVLSGGAAVMIVIRGAEVYNPAQGYEPQFCDIWIEGDRIIAPPDEPAIAQVIDGRGKIIAPAGVEIHTHVAGYPLNAARRFLFQKTTSSDSLIPSPADAAKRYLQLGYTTVFDAASSPLFARSTLDDLQQMNGLDRGTFTLLGDNKLLLKRPCLW